MAGSSKGSKFDSVGLRPPVLSRIQTIIHQRKLAREKRTVLSDVVEDAMDALENRPPAQTVESGLTPGDREHLRSFADMLRATSDNQNLTEIRDLVLKALSVWEQAFRQYRDNERR